MDLNDSINNKNSNHDDNDKLISNLNIPNGLKEMLIDHQFTIDKLHDVSPENLAITLGIDTSVARIIIDAVKDAVKELYDKN